MAASRSLVLVGRRRRRRVGGAAQHPDLLLEQPVDLGGLVGADPGGGQLDGERAGRRGWR